MNHAEAYETLLSGMRDVAALPESERHAAMGSLCQWWLAFLDGDGGWKSLLAREAWTSDDVRECLARYADGREDYWHAADVSGVGVARAPRSKGGRDR